VGFFADVTPFQFGPYQFGMLPGDRSMTVLVEADALKKTFGPITAVKGISLAVKKGEVLGFLGPNGAGKSTTMKMLSGFLEPDSGSARICGHTVQDQPKLAKTKLGYLPEGAPAYGEMTARSFLSFIGEIRGFDRDEITKRIASASVKAGLEQVLEQRIETLSKGYKRRVGIAQAILHDPPVLILDEPTDGLDPNQKFHVRKLIADMAADKAIIISTHILEEVEAVCTRAVVIAKGEIVADGTAEDLMKRLDYHGAVVIKVANDKADAIKSALSGLKGVSKVEVLSKENGSTKLRAMPKDGATIATEVASILAAKSLNVDELFVERGKLDDVFRQITVPADKSHSADKRESARA
jgi:ABC-2 type transport system ATP-binding protein